MSIKIQEPAHIANIKKASERLRKRFPEIKRQKMLDHASYALYGVENYHEARKLAADTGLKNNNTKQLVHIASDYHVNLNSIQSILIEKDSIQIIVSDAILIDISTSETSFADVTVVSINELKRITREIRSFAEHTATFLSVGPNFYINLNSIQTIDIDKDLIQVIVSDDTTIDISTRSLPLDPNIVVVVSSSEFERISEELNQPSKPIA